LNSAVFFFNLQNTVTRQMTSVTLLFRVYYFACKNMAVKTERVYCTWWSRSTFPIIACWQYRMWVWYIMLNYWYLIKDQLF